MPSGRFFRLSDEVLELLDRLAARAGRPPGEVLEELVRTAAEAEGFTVPPDGAFLELEAVDETPAIGPDGRGRKVHFVAVDETGAQDLGDFFVPDDTARKKPKG
ncbi:MAG TPA: ribbon-helix-helix domain-containing protein [Thermoanaerobaculia bacterium]|nr:ribbon-helix-helix domain-containing protein [Thermoanaerobaculia bacterium]